MDVRIESLIEGARKAQGTVVIVDVFRAFTTAAIALSKKANKIIMVAEPDDALTLRERGVGDLCIGEVDGKRPEGFDFGNSPFELLPADLANKTLIQSTRAGTVGISSVNNAQFIYAASFVVARSTVEAIRNDAPDVVTIIAMGFEGLVRTDEDEICALYLRNLLEGRQPDRGAVRKLILAGGEVVKYSDPGLPHLHPKDCEIALKIDSIDFAIRVTREDGFFIARPCSKQHMESN